MTRKGTMEGLEEVFNTEETLRFNELDEMPTDEKKTESKEMVVTEKKDSDTIEPTLGDSEYLRRQLKILITKSQSALDVIVDAVEESEVVRGAPFEAIAKLTDAIAKAISKLTELSSKEKENEYKGKPNGIGTINNNLILGTTEVLKLINDNKEGKQLSNGQVVDIEVVDSKKR